MKNFFFILFILPIISYCQIDYEFKLQSSFEFDWKEYKCISENDCFFLDLDTNDFSVTMYYSFEKNGNKQTIEIMDISDFTYGSDLNIYKNKTDNSCVLIWKIDGEFAPSFYVYYIKNGKLTKIGEWGVIVPCKNCDSGDYSVEDIRIHQKNDEIEFSFLEDANFIVIGEDYNYDNWGTFDAGELKVSFNIIERLLKKVER